MGKRGVILLFAIMLIFGLLIISRIDNRQLMEVSQVTGHSVSREGSPFTLAISETLMLAINETLIDEFNRPYLESGEKEFLLCLDGEREGNAYVLTGFYEPSYSNRSNGKVIYSGCQNAIGTLHNHYNPTNDEYFCQFTARDICTVCQGEEDIMGIICGQGQLVFMHKDDLREIRVKITTA